jgi:tetratricopeptide (TPR) repeat protein
LGIALVTLALVGTVWIELPRLVASRAMRQSEALIAIKAGPDAVTQATRAILSDPRRAEYWSSLGTGLSQTNALAAVQALTVAARREPWNPLHWQNLAIIHRAAGNYAGAVAAARRAVMTEPNGPEGHRLLGVLFLDRSSFAAAASEGQQAIAAWPDERSYDLTILAYIKLERWPDAVQLAQEALGRGDSTHLRLRFAQALTGAGRFADAATQLAVVLAATPDDPEALDLKAFLASKR